MLSATRKGKGSYTPDNTRAWPTRNGPKQLQLALYTCGAYIMTVVGSVCSEAILVATQSAAFKQCVTLVGGNATAARGPCCGVRRDEAPAGVCGCARVMVYFWRHYTSLQRPPSTGRAKPPRYCSGDSPSPFTLQPSAPIVVPLDSYRGPQLHAAAHVRCCCARAHMRGQRRQAK